MRSVFRDNYARFPRSGLAVGTNVATEDADLKRMYHNSDRRVDVEAFASRALEACSTCSEEDVWSRAARVQTWR